MLTLLNNAMVYAPQRLGMRNLLIGGGQILAISESPLVASGATVVDLAGQRLLPGFVDGHAHVTGGGGEAGFKTRVPPPSLSDFTAAGVTSVVGVLGTDDITRDTRGLLAQTQALRDEGMGAWCHTGGYHVPPVTLTSSVRDDIVHLDPVIGVGELAISDHRSSQPTLAEFLRIASDTHVAGLITRKAGILHLHLGDGPRGMDLIRQALHDTELPGRVFNPTHINRRKALLDEAIDVAKQGCTVDITAFPVGDDEDAWAAEVALTRYLDSGAPANRITISSDGGGCLPVFDDAGSMLSMDVGSASALLSTLVALLQQGMPLETALPAFTSNVADLLRLVGRGHIQVGYQADLLILDDAHCLSGVMIAGRWHRKDGQQVIKGYFET